MYVFYDLVTWYIETIYIPGQTNLPNTAFCRRSHFIHIGNS